MAELDQAILVEGYSPPTPSTDFSTLSPAQLAASSFLSELNFLTRQRAYTEFLRRRAVYRSTGDKGKHRQEPLFDLASDFEIPTSLSRLPPAQLLLLQFNPACTSSTLVGEAGHLFFAAVEEAKTACRAVTVELHGYQLQWEGGQKEVDLRCRLEWGEEQLEVVREESGRVDFTIRAYDLLSAELVSKTVTDGTTLRLHTAMLSTSLSLSIADVNVCLFIRASTLSGSVEAVLRRNVELTTAKQNPTNEAQMSSTTSSRERRDRRRPASTPSFLSPAAKVPRLSLTPSSSSSNTGEGYAELWQFLGEEGAEASWQPGFWRRQIAFIEAVAPHDAFTFPAFSSHEIRLLSHSPDVSKLPPLLLPRTFVSSGTRPYTRERLAIERMYRHASRRITNEETRTLLCSGDYPAVHAYATILARIVEARDAVFGAYQQLLQRHLYPRSRDRTTVDPIANIIGIVLLLSSVTTGKHRIFRFVNFDSNQLTARPEFTAAEIGIGPLRRYSAKLEAIVAEEESILGGRA